MELCLQDDNGDTALMLAAANGKKLAIDMILFQTLILFGWGGVRELINIRNAEGRLAKEVALKHRQGECARIIDSFEEREQSHQNVESLNLRCHSLEEIEANSIDTNGPKNVIQKRSGLTHVRHSFRKYLGVARSFEADAIKFDKSIPSRKASENQDRFNVDTLIDAVNDKSGGNESIQEFIASDRKTFEKVQSSRNCRPSRSAELKKSHSVASLMPGRKSVGKHSTNISMQIGMHILPEYICDSDSPTSSNCSPSTGRQAISHMIREKSNIEKKLKVQRVFNVNHMGKPQEKGRISGKIRWFLGQQNPLMLYRTSSEQCLTSGQSSDSSLDNSLDYSNSTLSPTSVDFDSYGKQIKRPSAAVPSKLPSKKPILLRTPKDMLAERAVYQRILASNEDSLSNRSVKLPPIKTKQRPSYEC